MTNLATYLWTSGDDVVISLSSAYLAAGQSASTGNGNDSIVGISVIPGLTTFFGSNEDQFISGAYVGPSGVYLGTGSVLNTGNGLDLIAGTGANGLDDPTSTVWVSAGNGGDGIRNRGTILTGNGSDAAIGINPEFGPLIRGQGGNGANGTSSSLRNGSDGGDGGAGIRNLGTGTIKTANGGDLLLGIGGNGGDGGNGYVGDSSGSNRNGGNGGDGGDGIHNDTGGKIETGNGDDAIIGIGGSAGAGGAAGNNGSSGAAGRQGFGIYNSGTIDMGRGDDVIDASRGGFGGSGTVKMGLGNDVVKGFGSGTFFADKGFDQLIFNSGTYNVAAGSSTGSFNITNGAIPGVTMVVSGFESLNGQAFATGAFVVV